MSGFTKLFSSITESSIWCEDDKVLRVWVAMLARVNADGMVEASVPGFANLCRMSIEEMTRCLARLKAPDPYSRTPDHDGRRIEDAPGGWKVLNYQAYRERGQAKDGSKAPYMRKYREERKKRRQQDPPDETPATSPAELRVTGKSNALPCKVTSKTEAEAEADTPPSPLKGGESGSQANTDAAATGSGQAGEAAESPKGVETAPEPPKAQGDPKTPQGEPIPKKSLRMAAARPVLHLLNQTAGRQFRETEANLLLIAARLEEREVTLEGVMQMVRRQCALWRPDPKMSEYLRPQTLFNRKKFDSYYANRDLPTDHRNGNGHQHQAPAGGSRVPGTDRNRFIAGADDVGRECERLAAENARLVADPDFLPFG